MEQNSEGQPIYPMGVHHPGIPSEGVVLIAHIRIPTRNGFTFFGNAIKVIDRIRRAVGPNVTLHIDANNGYTSIDEAIRVCDGLEPFDVTVVEDIYNGSLEDDQYLRSQIKSKYMIDGNGYWPNAFRIVQNGAADVINMHPRNQGGLEVSLRIQALATAAGIETRIGSTHILGIGDAAFQILGSVIALTMPVEDLGPLRYEYHFGSSPDHYQADANSLIVRELFPVESGEVIIPDRPGLGIEIDQEKLERITIDKITLS